MKQYINLIMALTISILFAACSNDINDVSHFSANGDLGTESNIILQERNPNLPKAVTKKSVKTRSDVSGEIGNSDTFLGHAYNLSGGNFVLGYFANVNNQVVDLDAIKAYDQTYVMGKQLLDNETTVFAYSNFDRYQYNSMITKKVKSGFSINLKVLSFGKKKATTEVFKSLIDNTSQSAYGELSINFKNSEFTLQASEATRKLYARQFLTKSFIRSLYGSPIASVLDSYGDFVLTGYDTGGKAYATYLGKTTDNINSEGKETAMTQKIEASLNWKGKSASGDLGFTGGDSCSKTNTFKADSTYIYIKTLGGKQDGSETSLKPVSLKGLNIDLTSWMRSLSDVSTHTMIDIADNGLYPMSDFVLEKNFKQRFDDTFNGVLEKKTELVYYPYIEIVRVFVRSTSSYESLYDVAAVLITRQGDRIILSDGKATSATDDELRENANSAVFLKKVENIAAEKSKLFSSNIEISYNVKTRLNPILRSPLCIDLAGFNEKNFYRFYNIKTSMEYIYDPFTRLCFSYFVDDGDDGVLDVYGIRDWAELLPARNISIASLANSYQIIGL